MYIIKGFCVIPSVVSNIPNDTWRVGELDRISHTYARDVTTHIDPSKNDIRLDVFSSKLNNIEIMTDPDDASYVINVLFKVVSYFRTANLPIEQTDFLEYVYSVTNVTRFNFGQVVNTAKISLPEWVDFYYADETKRARVWFSNQAFTEQYDDFHITVIPPIDTVDYLVNTAPLVVKELIESLTPVNYIERIESAKSESPQTFIRTIEAEFFSDTTPVLTFKTYWNVLIYGPNGDNIDSIKDAISAFILANSDYDRDYWLLRLPFIFKRTEFVLLPRWDLIAIENMSTQTGVYSSVIDPIEAINFTTNYINYYDSEYIRNNVELIPYPYKGLSICIVAGEDNEDENTKFKLKYPDYIPVSSMSLDFNRMSNNTREFLDLLEEMVIAAEVLDEFTDIPSRYRRVKRDNKYYISLLFNNVQYLVASKVYY